MTIDEDEKPSDSTFLSHKISYKNKHLGPKLSEKHSISGPLLRLRLQKRLFFNTAMKADFSVKIDEKETTIEDLLITLEDPNLKNILNITFIEFNTKIKCAIYNNGYKPEDLEFQQPILVGKNKFSILAGDDLHNYINLTSEEIEEISLIPLVYDNGIF